MAPELPSARDVRLAEIRRFSLGEGAHGESFDGIVELAAQACACPVALVSIVHSADQRFEAAAGTGLAGTGLEMSVCAHAIRQDEMLEIPDMRLDLRTRDNPLVTDPDDPFLFYAGAQIRTADGVNLGTLCVLDRRPRRLGDKERRALRVLADQVMKQLELHEALRTQDAMRREVDHRVKNSLANVAAMTRLAGRGASEETRAALRAVEQRITVMSELHGDLYRSDDPEGPIEIDGYLSRIAGHLAEIAPPGVEVVARMDPIRLAGRRASALGVLVNEMVSNACKHAFPDGRAGRIRVEGRASADGRYVLVCEDDGVGAAGGGGVGLGQRIMEASALQLDGLLRLAPGLTGFRAELDFPVPAA